MSKWSHNLVGHNENVVFTLGGKGDKYETSHLMREKVSNTIYVVNFWLNRCILKSQGFFRLKVVSIYMRENRSLQIISRSIFDSDMELCLFRSTKNGYLFSPTILWDIIQMLYLYRRMNVISHINSKKSSIISI